MHPESQSHQDARGLTPVQFPWDYNDTHRYTRLHAVQPTLAFWDRRELHNRDKVILILDIDCEVGKLN